MTGIIRPNLLTFVEHLRLANFGLTERPTPRNVMVKWSSFELRASFELLTPSCQAGYYWKPSASIGSYCTASESSLCQTKNQE